MRRALGIGALIVFVAAMPLWAQRRSFSSPPSRGFVAARPGGRVIIGGGAAFGHNPRFGVFVNSRPFHHHRPFRFYRPYPFGYPYVAYPYYGYPYAYTAYPYLGYGLQSDLVYSTAPSAPAYMDNHDTGLQNEVYRLQAEVDQLRQQQAATAERQQYALSSPTANPQPIPAARPRQEAPAPPTVLVFLDGRREQVQNYAVAGQSLWIFTEDRARKIPLADLNLDATRQINEQRGIEFVVHPAHTPSR